MFHKLMVTKHEYSQGVRTERKTTKFSNISSEPICGRGRRKYDRPFVYKEFHMTVDIKIFAKATAILVPMVVPRVWKWKEFSCSCSISLSISLSEWVVVGAFF